MAPAIYENWRMKNNTNLLWKLKRLQAMGLYEIAHRGVCAVSQSLEKWRISRGWTPLPSHTVSSKMTLFSVNENWQNSWHTHNRLDIEALTALKTGLMDFFGHASIFVGSPVKWHRDPVTGVNAPLTYGKAINYRDDSLVGNIKFLWELGRHQHLIPLAVAYAVTGDTHYLETVSEQIEAWINANPFALGIHWCNALEVALRLISWAVIHSLIAIRKGDDGLFSAVQNRDVLGNSIFQQTWFVSGFLSSYSSANNHLIGELTGLWVAAQVFEMGSAGAKWGELARIELEQECGLQIFSDGVDKEQAFYYHLWVLEYLLFASLVGIRAGKQFSDFFHQRIHAMSNFLRDVSPQGGRPPQVGDADDGFVTRFEARWPADPYGDILAAEAYIYRDILPETFPQKAFWYGMIAGIEPKNICRKQRKVLTENPYPRLYAEGGYAMLGDKHIHIVFDAGSLGYPSIAAHGHADALSFCMAVDKNWWLVDTGTYMYHSCPEWRDYFRGTAAHNTLAVDGRNQSLIGGPFLWLRHANAHIRDHGVKLNGCQWVRGSHDGYIGSGVVHYREIHFYSDTSHIKIIDFVDGRGEHDLTLHFHFAPEVSVVPGGQDRNWLAYRADSSQQIKIGIDTDWQWDVVRGSEAPILGWYSKTLNIKEPASTLQGRWNGELPVKVISTIQIG